jgi:hypothetical protein
MLLLTNSLNIHLNIGQNLIMNTPSVFISLETTSIESLSNKLIEQMGNVQIHIPSNIQLNSNNNLSVSLRVRTFCFLHIYCFLVLSNSR